MPEKGLLQFFVNNDDCYGYNGPCEVRYMEKDTTDEREMLMTCCCESYDDLFKEKPFNEEQKEKMWDEFDGAGSRVGGYPYFVQSEPAYYNEYNILLLQLDVEDECGIMFGDSGNCNFFISEEDLKNGDFSRVEYDWQCC